MSTTKTRLTFPRRTEVLRAWARASAAFDRVADWLEKHPQPTRREQVMIEVVTGLGIHLARGVLLGQRPGPGSADLSRASAATQAALQTYQRTVRRLQARKDVLSRTERRLLRETLVVAHALTVYARMLSAPVPARWRHR